MQKKIGSEGFEERYWKENYKSPKEMDNIGNRKEHLRYLKSYLELELYDVSSIIDLGFGLGFLFEEAIKAFKPYRAYGIEPSEFAFLKASKRLQNYKEKHLESMKLKLEQKDLKTWALETAQNQNIKAFDLGFCTSVFQYLTDEEIEFVVPQMSRACKVVYFSSPTDIELKRQREELEFFDEYAIRRKKERYYELMQEHFTFVSSRILESKYYFDEENTQFSELLFRF